MEVQEITPSEKARPFNCKHCQATFRRDEHLQRHVRSHTGEKRYQCLCGVTFSRNDVFLRHFRGCRKSPSGDGRRLPISSKSTTKTKRACDECAKSKAKCDHQVPCGRCSRRSLKCEKIRDGYVDPYIQFSVQTTPCKQHEEANLDMGDNTSHGYDEIASIDLDRGIPCMSAIGTTATAPIDTLLNQGDNNSQHPEANDPDSASFAFMPPFFADQNFNFDLSAAYGLSSDSDLNSCDWDPASIYFASWGNLEHLFYTSPVSQSTAIEGLDSSTFHQPSSLGSGNGFSLARLDPLESKCQELIELLHRSNPNGSEEIIASIITRLNIVNLCYLYGKNFQQNLPIIHSPTFNILTTPPVLLLAIMLVGACYSKEMIPAANVMKLAMRLLVAIGDEPHEKMMQCPQISTIQAGILMSCILSCSSDETVSQSARLCFARNSSMCERAGLFEAMDSVNYTSLTEETFDWQLWIEQESRRRIACEMFCQDMVHCIFLGRTPDLEPTQFPVELPSYEACWNAESASECLHNLQSYPQQIRVSAAIGMLNSWPDSKSPLFEASGFGMNVLISGLHCLLHQTTHNDVTLSMNSAKPPDTETTTAMSQLQHNLSGSLVTNIADRVVKAHGSPAIIRVNGMLNSWYSTLNLRKNRDIESQSCFKGDSMPFWWLAKLYLVLHYYSHILAEDSDFAKPRAERLDRRGKSKVQRKIVGWLSTFRGHKTSLASNGEKENWLADLMKPRQE